MTSFGYKRSARSALGQGARMRYLKTGLAKAEARARRRESRKRQGYKTPSRMNYVDGYLDVVVLHELSAAADDTWADCELDPRQNSAVYGCMPVPKVGTGAFDRNDRKIFLKNIKIRGTVLFNGENTLTTSGGNGYVRLVIVKDMRTNGLQLNAEDVLSGAPGSDGNTCTSGDGGAISFYTNPNGWNRYKVIKDIIIRQPAQPAFFDGTDGAINNMHVPFKINIKANCMVNFSGVTGAVASIIDNSFHMIGAKFSDSGSASISYYVRTSFIDA